jgi:hypothetical protein
MIRAVDVRIWAQKLAFERTIASPRSRALGASISANTALSRLPGGQPGALNAGCRRRTSNFVQAPPLSELSRPKRHRQGGRRLLSNILVIVSARQRTGRSWSRWKGRRCSDCHGPLGGPDICPHKQESPARELTGCWWGAPDGGRALFARFTGAVACQEKVNASFDVGGRIL